MNLLASFVSFSYLYSFLVVLISIRWVKRRHGLGSELYLYCSDRHRLGACPLDLRGLRIWISPVPYPYRNYSLTVAGLSKRDAEAMLETTAWYVTCSVQLILISTIVIIPPLANIPFMSYTIFTALLSFIFVSLQRKVRDRLVEICAITFVALLTISTFLRGDAGAILRIIDMAILIYTVHRYMKLPSRPLYELRFGKSEAH